MKYVEINKKMIKVNNMDTFFKRLVGLMFRKKTINEVYLFIKTNGIHMFFMFQSIDVILADKNFKVLETYQCLKPWKIIPPKKNVFYTLEMPLGTSNYFNKGDILTFKDF